MTATPLPHAHAAPAILTEERLGNLEALLADNMRALARLQGLVERLASDIHHQGKKHDTDWTEEGYPVAPAGEPIFFDSQHDNAAYLANGWWAPEPWGVWGSGGPQIIRFAVGDDYRGGYADVKLTLQAYAPAEIDPPQVDICANGFFLGTFTLKGTPQIFKLRLTPACIDKGNILLHLSLHRQYSPLSIGDGQDQRILGVGLLGLVLG